jgi:hypothetical protein
MTPQAEVGVVDRFTRTLATSISRRSLFRATIVGGLSAAVGVPLLDPVPVSATNCNTCGAPCATCFSQSGSCCSPNGAYCYTGTCNCRDCGCICFYASIQVCDDGSNASSCPCCCFICFPCC